MVNTNGKRTIRENLHILIEIAKSFKERSKNGEDSEMSMADVVKCILEDDNQIPNE